MDLVRWLTLAALSMFLLEGFTLSVFPQQFQQLLATAEPRTLQVLGVVETMLAIGLIVGILAGCYRGWLGLTPKVRPQFLRQC